MRITLALDGTADITSDKRLAVGYAVGPECRVAIMPAGLDPDDLQDNDIDAVAAQAVPVIDLFMSKLRAADADSRGRIERDFFTVVRAWRDRGLYTAVRQSIIDQLKYDPKVLDQIVFDGTDEDSNGGSGGGGDLAPLGPVDGSNRPDLCNFEMLPRQYTDAKGQLKTGPKRIARTDQNVLSDMLAVTHGWPARIHSPGSKSALLFVHAYGGLIKWLQSATDVESFLQERARVQFCSRQDYDGTNFISSTNLYSMLGRTRRIREYLTIETLPHEPRIDGHYYAWQAPTGEADGEAFLKMIRFFGNVEDDVSKVVLCAAILSLFWGGGYGQRPCVVFEAKRPGSGKSTVAMTISKLVGGYIKVQLGGKSGRAEDQLLERLLSPSALEKRLLIWDNIHATVQGELVESLITDTEITGKRMFHGEASRPNSLQWYLTLNNARLSSDMARRSFRVGLEKPAQDPNWRKNVENHVVNNRDQIIADILAILRTPIEEQFEEIPWGEFEETNTVWVEAVLFRAAQFLRARGDIHLSNVEILRGVADWRTDRDTDISEAREFWEGLIDRATKEDCLDNDGFLNNFGFEMKDTPVENLYGRTQFIGTQKMMRYWSEIFDQKLRNNKTMVSILENHIAAGRLKGLDRGRDSKGLHGFKLSCICIKEHLVKLHEDKSLLRADANKPSEPSDTSERRSHWS